MRFREDLDKVYRRVTVCDLQYEPSWKRFHGDERVDPGGQSISIVAKQQNSRDENARARESNIPKD
jgi:hypothetical protein